MSLAEDKNALAKLEVYHADLEDTLRQVKNNITVLRFKIHKKEKHDDPRREKYADPSDS